MDALVHNQVWKSTHAIDAYSIGEEKKRQRRGDVRGTLPRAEHGTVWSRTDTLDSFTVFREDDESSAQDEASDVCGLIPDLGDELR